MHVDAHLISGFSDSPFEQVAHTQLTPQVRRTLPRRFYGRDRGMRRYIDSLNLGELGGDFIGHSVSEVSAVRIAAEILQWENGHGRFHRNGRGAWRGMFLIPEHAADRQQRQQHDSAPIDAQAWRAWRGPCKLLG